MKEVYAISLSRNYVIDPVYDNKEYAEEVAEKTNSKIMETYNSKGVKEDFPLLKVFTISVIKREEL